MMAEHIKFGEKGEALAKSFLIEKGYTILRTNYRFKNLEIDIIAKIDELLVVVEVKTRNNKYLAGPHDTVTKTKQKHIIKCANAYIQENEVDLEARFDIISILRIGNHYSIDHIEDAFYAT